MGKQLVSRLLTLSIFPGVGVRMAVRSITLDMTVNFQNTNNSKKAMMSFTETGSLGTV